MLISLVAACSNRVNASRILMEVNGVPIIEEDFNRQLEYELSYQELKPDDQVHPQNPGLMTLEQVKRKILWKELIPMAVVRAAYKEKIPTLMEEAGKIMHELSEDGSDFAEKAAKYSGDSNAQKGGCWRTVTRRSLYYPLPRILFNAEPNEIIGPVLSLVGCHIVWMQEKHKGMMTSDDTLVASHILLPFEAGRMDFLPVVIDQLVKEAHIVVKDPAFAALADPEKNDS
ncbi:MAG: peptidylprolyl isomerase [Planctomycetota bacterium]